ncbi:replication stress response regulator SDE2-like isoform X1 [Triticum dicoccoides]|uniref:replication stress response regulator SDE2-like isoform X1 n=1 Tax=Triticum dicoccoides TaxID=85692 RepID=UPI000E79784D|nr:replication stress response regulator SDE2-like isoform X1 [Triticum dicoccoides]
MAEASRYQILVRLLDGRTHCLRFSTPTVSGAALLDAVSALSRVPAASLRLVTGRLDISPSSVLASFPDGQFPSASALLRLRGGKGGFGSLLRGAASKAGQKKTSNFDACRDINGRRLRHVNAERRLEEWRAEAADRQLEKLAEDFLKKKAKESGRGGARAAEVDKYLEKYRKDAESCVNAVEESVRASLGKRKAVPKPRDAKKLKIWMGKKKVADDESDSDSDSDVDDNEGADAKPIALDHGNYSNESNESEEEKVDLASVSGSHSEGESSGEKSQSSDSEENGNALQESMEVKIRSGCDFESQGSLECEGGTAVQPAPENTSENGTSEIGKSALSEEVLKSDAPENTSENGTSENGKNALSEEVLKSDDRTDVDNTGSATSSLLNDPVVPPGEESADVNNKSLLSEEPVDLATFSSAAELEALGMEKLKLELQTHGLKCGGTLKERAARLFLLKTTPVDKLPKKLLAKPNSGGK